MTIDLARTPDTAAADADGAELWILRLYVAGQSPRSLRALANLRRICAEDLDVRYRLEVIDLYQQPELAQFDQIVALPALIKRLPEPLRSIVGDMSNKQRVQVALDLLPRAPLLPITSTTAGVNR
jgi:circadian clock protein KaiB